MDRADALNGELRAVRAEWARPWKLATLAAGIALLVAGSIYTPAPDWDVPISFIMAALAYLTAPWALRVVVERRRRSVPLMLLLAWFTVDGAYWLYWRWKDPVALAHMRDANFLASLCLYVMCGLVWYPRASVREMLARIRARV